MINRFFQEILDKLERGETPQLTKTVNGQTYARVFLPENRLILLGGGHIAQSLCARRLCWILTSPLWMTGSLSPIPNAFPRRHR